MKNKYTLGGALLCSGVLALAITPAYADMACDLEIAAIQTGIDGATVSATDLEQAQYMLDVLTQDCAGGSTLEGVASLSSAARALLGMGDGS